MLENLIYFVLGLLSATLIALLIAPAIWRRAVALTRARLEQAMPLTLSELQAEKDQLRAEHAVAIRKLEVREGKLKKDANARTIEVNRKRDEMLAAEDELARKNGRIAELEGELSVTKSEREDNIARLTQTTHDLQAARAEMADRALSLEEMKNQYDAITDDFDGQKIEIVARETRLDTARQETREAREAAKKAQEALDRQNTALKLANEDIEKQRKAVASARRKETALQAAKADLEARLERRNADLAKLRDKAGKPGKALADAEAEIDRLHEKLAAKAAEPQVNTPSPDPELALKRAEAEREALRIELSTLKLADSGGAEALARHNADLRDAIADLAARITANAAEMQGAGSPINEALARETDADRAASNVHSLADRIRALQRDSESA
ncbi:MAG: hypothetical protein AAFO70_00785 [Pseudomonadota bacterium]